MKCQEVVLLDEAIETYNEGNFDKIDLICMIEDIIAGLCVPNNQKQKEFWRSNVVLLLLDKALKTVTYSNDYCCTLSVSWETFFDIIYQTKLVNSLLGSLFSLQSEELLHVVMSNWQSFVWKQSNYLTLLSTIAVLEAASLSSLLYAYHHGMFSDLASKAKVLLQIAYETTPIKDNGSKGKLETFHCENIKISSDMIKMCSDVCATRDPWLDVQEKFEYLSNILPFKSAYLQHDLMHHVTKYMHVSNKSKAAMKRSIHKDLEDLLSIFLSTAAKLSIEKNAVGKSISNSVTTIAVSVQHLFHCDSADLSVICDWLPNKECNALVYAVENLLPNYNKSVTLIIQHMLSGVISDDDMNKYIACLQKNPQCLSISSHVIDLFCLLQKLVYMHLEKKLQKPFSCKWIHHVKQLFVTSFELLSLNSKINMLEYFLNELPLKPTVVDYLTHDILGVEVTQETRIKLNNAFNTFTKSLSLSDKDNADIIHSIANMTVLSPKLAFENVVNWLMVHEDSHAIFIAVFEKIPLFSRLVCDKQKPLLLECVFSLLNDNHSEKAIQNFAHFFGLLLHVVNDSAKIYLTHGLLELYVLPMLSSNSCEASSVLNVSIAVKVFDAVFSKCSETLALLTSIQIAMVAISLAKKLESVNLYGLHLMLKRNLRSTVMELGKKLCEEPDNSLLEWCVHTTSCFHWITQLHFRTLTSQISCPITVLPKCLSSVCSLPKDMKIHLAECYGEGFGLTAWLQCFIVDPNMLPVSCLKFSCNISEQDMFCNGMVVALTEVLPKCDEDEWHAVIDAVKALLDSNCLYVACPLLEQQFIPFVDLTKCKLPLSLAQLLHRVTNLLRSDCCSNWMLSLWHQYLQCYVATIRNLCGIPVRGEDTDMHTTLYLFYCLFQHVCDDLSIVDKLPPAQDILFVLCMDLITDFSVACGKYKTQLIQNNLSTLTLEFEVSQYKTIMLDAVELLSDSQMEESLHHKVDSISV